MSFTVCNDGARPLSFFFARVSFNVGEPGKGGVLGIPTQVAFDGTRHTVGGCLV